MTAIDGAALLNEVEAFHRRFNVFPHEAAFVAVTLWDAHAHLLDCFDSTPRIAFLSPEPGSGKTRALEIVETLVPQPMTAVNASAAALFRSVSSGNGKPTILFDEIDTVFGPKAGDNEELRGFLNAGHRRTGGYLPVHRGRRATDRAGVPLVLRRRRRRSRLSARHDHEPGRRHPHAPPGPQREGGTLPGPRPRGRGPQAP
ncbi:hypothetical protein STENM36S_04285 [Streptomyces tendae]